MTATLRGLWTDCGRGRGDGGSLGDLICWTSEAEAASNAVQVMNSVYKAGNSPLSFQPYVDVINSKWKDVGFDDTPNLLFFRTCEAKELGQQAEQLSQTMAREFGLHAPVPNSKLAGGVFDQLGKLLLPAALLAGAVVAAPYAKKLLEDKK